MIQWSWLEFAEFSPTTLYAVLKLRQDVFVIEQTCLFQDLDDADQRGWHLLGTASNGVLAAYLRLLPPDERHAHPSLGRVVTAPDARGNGIGRALLVEGIRQTRTLFAGRPIQVSAQHHLERFYCQLGFETVGEPYDDDGILHIDMVLRA